MLEFLIGFFAGIICLRIYATITMHFLEKRLERKIDDVLTEFRKNVINSRIEFVNGIYFMYNRDTNEFLGQGNTFEELEKTVKVKYPNKLFNVPSSELQELFKGEK
jgi:hypothetical protein